MDVWFDICREMFTIINMGLSDSTDSVVSFGANDDTVTSFPVVQQKRSSTPFDDICDPDLAERYFDKFQTLCRRVDGIQTEGIDETRKKAAIEIILKGLRQEALQAMHFRCNREG